ncbi:metal-dependent hydrolase [Candidatus Woesearchaeota archaeon]|nr:metal-dependent hydrolase [Candidatus Woesearchaeota archaeon]
MMYYTHAAFGLLLSLLYIEFFNVENPVIFLLVVLFFSLFPDIDESKSKIGRKNKVLSKTINFFFGHRGIFHTIWIPSLLFLVLILFNVKIIIGIAVLIGYISHLFLDAITKHGIMPFYPIYNKRINGFFRTNSLSEKIFFIIIIALVLYLVIF